LNHRMRDLYKDDLQKMEVFPSGKLFRLTYDQDCDMLRMLAKNQTLLDELVEAFSVDNPSAFFSQQYGYAGEPKLYSVNQFGFFLPGLVFDVLDWMKTQYGSFEYLAMSARCKAYIDDFITPLKSKIGEHFETFDITEDLDSAPEHFEKRAYQDEAVDALFRKGYGRGLIEIPTAGGKSYILANFIWNAWRTYRPDARVLVMVPNVQLVEQLQKDFCEYGIRRELIAKLRGGMSKKEKRENDISKARIIVANRQSLADHIKEIPPPDVLICDEAHTCLAKSTAEMIQGIKARIRIGCSGTLPRDKHKLRQLTGMLGRVVYRENPMDLQAGGFISKLQITVYSICDKAVEADRNLLFHQDSAVKYVSADFNGINFDSAARAEHEYFAKWYGELYRPILDKTASMNGNTLVLFDKIDIGRSLYEKFRELYPRKAAFYTDGQTKVQERELIREGFEKSDGNVLFSNVQIMSTGVSIKRLHNVVFCFSSKSTTRVIQSIGRVLRLYDGKDQANLIDCVFNTKYSQRHYKERLRLYKEFYGKKQPDEIVRIDLN